jgi:hypothetical protein
MWSTKKSNAHAPVAYFTTSSNTKFRISSSYETLAKNILGGCWISLIYGIFKEFLIVLDTKKFVA